MALKWSIQAVYYAASRTDPNVLEYWASIANRFATECPEALSFDTKELAVAHFAGLTGSQLASFYLPYTPERISYPVLFGGPRSVYLPDVSPAYTEYPYTIEGYSYSFTADRGLDGSLYYTTLVIASGLDTGDVIPPPVGTPDPITIQLKRDKTISKYSINPPDASVLAKYGAPVKFIRGTFASGTRTAVITETLTGGFMIYEEASLGVATGPIYIYSNKRKIIAIVSATDINQYRLYTF